MQLRKRHVELQVDTIKVSPDLRVTFKTSKSYKPDVNTAEVSIFGLNPEHRAQLSKVKTPILKLAAGYGDSESGLTQLFYGTAIHVRHEVKDAEIISTISTTDGGKAKQTARVNITFGRNTKTDIVLKRIAQATGLGLGNVNKIAAELAKGVKAEIYSEGTLISGSACTELGHLLRSCGYEWSIQDETIQIRKIGQAAEGFAVRLSPETGLIGSPSISSTGVCSGTCLIFKAGAGLDLVPGRLIHVESAFVNGQFILAKTDTSGDTAGDEWYCQFESVTKKGDFKLV
jgi:baseplate hub protein gp41